MRPKETSLISILKTVQALPVDHNSGTGPIANAKMI
jgi:hypothetical protein